MTVNKTVIFIFMIYLKPRKGIKKSWSILMSYRGVRKLGLNKSTITEYSKDETN